MNAQQAADSPEDDQPSARTLEDAVRELRSLQQMQRTRKRAGREQRHLDMLTAQSERRRAPGPAPAGLYGRLPKRSLYERAQRERARRGPAPSWDRRVARPEQYHRPAVTCADLLANPAPGWTYGTAPTYTFD